jgi:hypothetical protein
MGPTACVDVMERTLAPNSKGPTACVDVMERTLAPNSKGPTASVDVRKGTFAPNSNQTPYHSTRTVVIIPREKSGSVCK